MLKARGYKGKRDLALSSAIIGKYYDNLTPAGAGGQGFQMYYLGQNGCDEGTAGALPIAGFLGLQFAFVIIGIFTMIFGNNYIEDVVAIRVTAIIGLCFYAFIPLCIIVFAIAPIWLEKIVEKGTWLLHKIHIIKDAEASKDKAMTSLRSYTASLRKFGESKRIIFFVLVLSIIYQIMFMMMPYFVLHFFGAHIGFSKCFCQVVYIYAAITIIFTPGNSGAAEASFYMVFSSLQGGAVFWAMLVWRLLCYYSWIILGAIIQFRDQIRSRKRS